MIPGLEAERLLEFHEVCKVLDIDMAPQSNENAHMEIRVCTCVGIEIVSSCVAFARSRSCRVLAFPSMTNLVIIMSKFVTLGQLWRSTFSLGS